jgi:hypothetical protein
VIKDFLIYAINIAIGAVITIFVTYKLDNSQKKGDWHLFPENWSSIKFL